MLLVLVKSILRLGTFCSARSAAILFWKIEAATAGGDDALRFRDADAAADVGSLSA